MMPASEMSRQHPVNMMPTMICCTGAYIGRTIAHIGPGLHNNTYNFQAPEAQQKRFKDSKKLDRKPLKSESKAQELLRDFIGTEQWKVYRKTNRVLVSQGSLLKKHFWMIGDVFGGYNKFHPFRGKPDVVRIDNPTKLYTTYFCVDQSGGESTPYTDKVILFATHLSADLKEFMKNANRLGERTFNKMKECAVWEIQ